MVNPSLSGHFAWCALVALALAKLDGRVSSEIQENLFLTRWLATALKQRRFSRDVTPEIEWLLKQGRTPGSQAKLASKLHYLWRSCCGELSEQSDLFRLTYAVETAKDTGWYYRLLSDREWAGRHAVTLSPHVNGIYLLKSALDSAFDDDGQQTGPLLVRLTGNIAGVESLLTQCGWRVAQPDGCAPHLYRLTAGREEERQLNPARTVSPFS